MKWDRKIEPVRYSEAKAQFLSATEDVARVAINYYFSLLMAQENFLIAHQNLENSQKLYEVAKMKREMGQISQNDLLQMELNLLDARTDMTDSESNLKSNMFQLRSFLDYGEDVDIKPEIPLTSRRSRSVMPTLSTRLWQTTSLPRACSADALRLTTKWRRPREISAR